MKNQQEVITSLRDKIKKLEHEIQQNYDPSLNKDKINNSQSFEISRECSNKNIDLTQIIPRLRLCLQVFENNLHSYLFESKITLTKDKFLETLWGKLNIEKNEDALILVNYFIPPDSTDVNTWKVMGKIIEIAGPYRSFNDSDFQTLKSTFEKEDQKKKELFIKRLKLLTNNK